jgi:hypothetical protein
MENTRNPRQLITTAGLMEWLNVSTRWIKDHVADPAFPVIDLAPEGSPRRTLRFDVEAVAAHLGIPVPPYQPQGDKQAANAA